MPLEVSCALVYTMHPSGIGCPKCAATRFTTATSVCATYGSAKIASLVLPSVFMMYPAWIATVASELVPGE